MTGTASMNNAQRAGSKGLRLALFAAWMYGHCYLGCRQTQTKRRAQAQQEGVDEQEGEGGNAGCWQMAKVSFQAPVLVMAASSLGSNRTHQQVGTGQCTYQSGFGTLHSTSRSAIQAWAWPESGELPAPCN